MSKRDGEQQLDRRVGGQRRANSPNGRVRLGVNAWRLQGQRTGVGRYLSNVLRHWTEERVEGRFDEINLYTPTPLDRRELELPQVAIERLVRPPARMLVWENLYLASRARDDVLFCPSYTRPLIARGRTVVTTHEATLHLYPQLYPRSARVFYDRLYGWSARHATLVISDSQVAARDVCRCYGVEPDRVRAIPLAPAATFRPRPGDASVEDVRARYVGRDVPFFLFVGKLTARRNVPKLIEAIAELRRRESAPHKLLIIGLNTTQLDIVGRAAELGAQDAVVHHEYVSDEDLSWLYDAASAFVMPYVYEALSLPIMEAQASGTPVITVDVPGLRETSGGAALMMSEATVSELVEAMSRIARDPAMRRELSARGLANSARFSWERCAAQTLDVLAEAATLVPPASDVTLAR